MTELKVLYCVDKQQLNVFVSLSLFQKRKEDFLERNGWVEEDSVKWPTEEEIEQEINNLVKKGNLKLKNSILETKKEDSLQVLKKVIAQNSDSPRFLT